MVSLIGTLCQSVFASIPFANPRGYRLMDHSNFSSVNQPASDDGDAPLPRSKRRRLRSKSDRGLPPDTELEKLAVAYLDNQRTYWQKLVEAGLLPTPNDEIVRQMVEDFKERHRSRKVDVASVRPFTKFFSKLAGSYNRYSCDNSNPNSVLDQMVKALEKGHAEDRFIPWPYVFADYSVTGLDPSRQGYTSYKNVLADTDHLIETTYIDDFTRASRDELEWWKLAALSKRLSKRMIGASDGFDVHSPDWDIKITIYGLVSRLFIKGLQQKVRRGMRGAARRGTCLGKLPLGFTRRVRRDQNDNVVRGPDGLPIHEPCVDPATSEHLLLMYDLFVQKKWSLYKIARHFNQLKVDEWDGWTPMSMRALLWNPSSIGVFIWNKTRREYDWEAEKWVRVKNPRSEWDVFYDPKLAIVPMEFWRAARRKLAAIRRKSPLTGRKPSRNQVSASTLFSGTLICEHCGAELKLLRSTSEHKQMGCINGIRGLHGCQLTSSKSTRIIEECLLGHIRDSILSDSRIEEVLNKAKAVVEAEAQKPQVNVAPLKAQARTLAVNIKKLFARIEKSDDEELCKAYDQRIKELQKELNDSQAKIRDAEARNRRRLKPAQVEELKTYLVNLRDLFNEEIPVAAEAIRALTGPIKICQGPVLGVKKGARWIAKFSLDFVRVLRHLAKDAPDSSIIGIGSFMETEVIEVPIERTPKYEKLVAEFKELRDKGASIQRIARSRGICWEHVSRILVFADTGKWPNWRNTIRIGAGAGGKPNKYLEIADEVARLKDVEDWSFEMIATKMNIALTTVGKAYNHARPEVGRDKAKGNGLPQRRGHKRLSQEKLQTIRELLKSGKKKPIGIAAEVGCSEGSVRRVRKAMLAELGEDEVA